MDHDSQVLTLMVFQRCLIQGWDILYLIKLGLTLINYLWKNFYTNATDTMIESNSFSNGLFERSMRWRIEHHFLSTLKRHQICSCTTNRKLFLKKDEKNSFKRFSKRSENQLQAKNLTNLWMILLKEFLTLIMTILASYLNLSLHLISILSSLNTPETN